MSDKWIGYIGHDDALLIRTMLNDLESVTQRLQAVFVAIENEDGDSVQCENCGWFLEQTETYYDDDDDDQ